MKTKYVDTVELPACGSDDDGTWHVCSYCEFSWRPGPDKEEHEEGCPILEVRELEEEVVRLREALNIDQTGLAQGLDAVKRSAQGHAWLGEPDVWGSYEYTEHTIETLRTEAALLISSIVDTATWALVRSGQIAADSLKHGKRLGGEGFRLASEDPREVPTQLCLCSVPIPPAVRRGERRLPLAGGELRYAESTDGDLYLDEVVIKRPAFLHLEVMSDSGIWGSVTLDDGTRLTLNFCAYVPDQIAYWAEIEPPRPSVPQEPR